MIKPATRDLFLLDPDVTFLNHGSFGACPRPVFEDYQRWQIELERQPVEFLGRRAPDLLATVREALGVYLNAPADSLALVMNATWGINVVIRSLDLEPGDEILTTNHEYGANTMAWEWLLAKSGASLIKHSIDLPVADAGALVDDLWSKVTERTKAIFLSHITSPTALILPVNEICHRAREHGILTIVDGAHAPGHLPLDLQEIGADIYSGNLHKWFCAPKGAGFLYVRPEEQLWVESLIVSWGWGATGVLAPSTFVSRNEWQGTRDIAPFLAIPAAITFQQDLGWSDNQHRGHILASRARSRVAELTGLPHICPDSCSWFGQMTTFPVPVEDPLPLKTRMYDEFRVELPHVFWNGQSFLRASFQAYNDESDIDRLIDALSACL
ncbi:MAG: aminotransferase class V-fold PLP-dependent enzyme [Thermomicrobiales bacterium]